MGLKNNTLACPSHHLSLVSCMRGNGKQRANYLCRYILVEDFGPWFYTQISLFVGLDFPKLRLTIVWTNGKLIKKWSAKRLSKKYLENMGWWGFGSSTEAGCSRHRRPKMCLRISRHKAWTDDLWQFETEALDIRCSRNPVLSFVPRYHTGLPRIISRPSCLP